MTRWRLAIAQEAVRVASSHKRTYEGSASLVILFFTHRATYLCLTHSSRSCNRDTPGGARNVLRLGALGVSSRIGGERFARTYLKEARWFVTFRTHARLLSSQSTDWQAFCCFCFCGWIFPWQGSASGNSSGSLLVSRFGRPTWRNGYTQAMILPTNKDSRIFLRLCRAQATKATSPNQKLRDDAPPAPRPVEQPDALHWKPTWLQGTAYFWERNEAPLPPLRPRCNFIHPRQLSSLPERLELPFWSDEILSGYEDFVSSGTVQFTAWVNTGPHATLVHHMVDVQKSYRRLSRGIRKEAWYTFSDKPLPQKYIQSFACAEAAEYLQLESRAPTRKRRCLR